VFPKSAKEENRVLREHLGLVRYHVLIVIDLASRRVEIGGITRDPTGYQRHAKSQPPNQARNPPGQPESRLQRRLSKTPGRTQARQHGHPLSWTL